MNKDFFENFTEFIKDVVRSMGSGSGETEVSMFDELPSVCSTEELATVYRSSKEVILKMAKDGMPHTHTGREYRFHKALLIEWTRTGGAIFPCQNCQNEDKNSNNLPEKLPEITPPTNVHNLSQRTNSKLAGLVG